jgi:hypothetical protein
MCMTSDQPRTEQSNRADPKSDLLQDLAQLQDRIALAGYAEARHFIAVAAISLEDAISREAPTTPLPAVQSCPG